MTTVSRHLLAALLALIVALPAQAQPIDSPFAPANPRAWERVVFQVNEDDPKKWNAVLANIRNVQAELGAKNVSIALVAISYGLGMLTADSLAANGVQDAIATGVEFIACGNSMGAQKVAKEDLIEGVTIAKAGYVELMRRQQQGWSYLRP
jgi:intracellular sulfur oxidation DsrE/DsrF family protein